MARRTQEPVTFEDVAVYLSRVEWDSITTGQRELYRRVMLDNYELLTSLGYPGPKPDILHRLERGEDPWVCTPQSTFWWAGPDSPSPGQDGDRRCLEEPSPGWWPGAGGHRVLGETTQPPCQGGRCMPWRLRLSRVLSKLRWQEAAAASRAAGSRRRRERAEPLPRHATGAAEARGAVPGNRPRSCRLPLQPLPQQRNQELAPRHRLRGDRAPGKAPMRWECRGWAPERPSENGAVLSDHRYCSAGGKRPHALRDHDYCWRNPASTQPLLDHQYCCVPRVSRRHIRCAPRTRTLNRAGCRQPVGRRSQIQRLVRKAKWTLWRREAGVGLADPRGSSRPNSRRRRAPLSALSLGVKRRQLRGRGPRVTSGGARDPAVASEPPMAGEAEEEAAAPGAVETQAGWRERVHPSSLSQLGTAYAVVLRTVRCMFCHNVERGGRSLWKDARPVSVGLSG